MKNTISLSLILLAMAMTNFAQNSEKDPTYSYDNQWNGWGGFNLIYSFSFPSVDSHFIPSITRGTKNVEIDAFHNVLTIQYALNCYKHVVSMEQGTILSASITSTNEAIIEYLFDWDIYPRTYTLHDYTKIIITEDGNNRIYPWILCIEATATTNQWASTLGSFVPLAGHSLSEEQKAVILGDDIKRMVNSRLSQEAPSGGPGFGDKW